MDGKWDCCRCATPVFRGVEEDSGDIIYEAINLPFGPLLRGTLVARVQVVARSQMGCSEGVGLEAEPVVEPDFGTYADSSHCKG